MQAEEIMPVSRKEEPEVAIIPASNLDADTLLQSSRRLDWRFLLASPELGRVACIGDISGDLQDALRLFSESVTLQGTQEDQGRSGADFDLAVVQGLSGAKLHLAAQVLKPGGYLYAENENLFSPKKKQARSKHWRFSLPLTAVKGVQEAGFAEVEAYWHWPNFKSCNRIIPLNDRGALHFSLETGSRTVKGRMRSLAGRLLLWSGLLEQSVTSFSIIARLERS